MLDDASARSASCSGLALEVAVAAGLRFRPGIVIDIPFNPFCFFAGIVKLGPSPPERLRFPFSLDDIDRGLKDLEGLLCSMYFGNIANYYCIGIQRSLVFLALILALFG